MKTIKNNKGYTLVELLMSCAIIILVSGLLITLSSTVFSIFEDVTMQAESQTLASTLKKKITSELYYAKDIDNTGTEVTYFSSDSGLGQDCSIHAINGILYVDNGTSQIPLISKGSYGYSLGADIAITYANDKFDVTLMIKEGAGSGNTILTKRFTVKPLNAY